MKASSGRSGHLCTCIASYEVRPLLVSAVPAIGLPMEISGLRHLEELICLLDWKPLYSI